MHNTMRRFFAPAEMFSADSVTLSAEETRHLRDVLRLGEGDKISVFDGRGREVLCDIATIDKRSSVAHIVGKVTPISPESSLDLTLGISLLKGEKFDLVIQKSVELGVKQITPLLTHRTDVKLNDSHKRIERWRRIALEATKQCGRAALMVIDEPVPFSEFVDTVTPEQCIQFVERGGTPFSTLSPSKSMVALVGPEGGWEETEVELARSKGVAAVTLGGRILRAETAAIAVAAILQHRFGDLN
jgi:16S rRNA (uracil1498-N3)-methyltransferase